MPPNFWDIFTIYKSKRNTWFSCAKKNRVQQTVRIWRLQGVRVFSEFLCRSSPFQALQLKWLPNLFGTSTVPSTDWGFFHENSKTDQLSELWKKNKKTQPCHSNTKQQCCTRGLLTRTRVDTCTPQNHGSMYQWLVGYVLNSYTHQIGCSDTMFFHFFNLISIAGH